jgi:hypothetical protein
MLGLRLLRGLLAVGLLRLLASLHHFGLRLLLLLRLLVCGVMLLHSNTDMSHELVFAAPGSYPLRLAPSTVPRQTSAAASCAAPCCCCFSCCCSPHTLSVPLGCTVSVEDGLKLGARSAVVELLLLLLLLLLYWPLPGHCFGKILERLR